MSVHCSGTTSCPLGQCDEASIAIEDARQTHSGLSIEPQIPSRAASLESTGMPMLHKELRKWVKSEDNICLQDSLQERSSKKPGRLSDECLRGRVLYRMGGQGQLLFFVDLKVSMTKPSFDTKSIPVMPYMRPQDKDPGRYVLPSSEPVSSSLFIRSTNKLTPRVNLSAWRNTLLRQERGGLEHDKNNLIPFSSVVECRKKYQEAGGSKRLDLITLMKLFWYTKATDRRDIQIFLDVLELAAESLGIKIHGNIAAYLFRRIPVYLSESLDLLVSQGLVFFGKPNKAWNQKIKSVQRISLAFVAFPTSISRNPVYASDGIGDTDDQVEDTGLKSKLTSRVTRDGEWRLEWLGNKPRARVQVSGQKEWTEMAIHSVIFINNNAP
ncbi:hypothetical protein QBC38DRAFT_488451 [Podospora fimiseda]|uniref:Uncharacterized protein n=1 Tax=Podospora fimiseda TaxID=252190 RepID=A0AAN6YSA1_9PEZI|nr:hypothetical protein QBC38DRAFT_488451 [Podospora fimiseda]